jgi:LuxR family maltose regulon positive regulatory protein
VQILASKLTVPPPRAKLVARPRLIRQLNQGFECGFVLVSAPAGYGKSTLLSAWLSQLDADAAWFSLDEGDNHPARFMAYLAAAFQKINPAVAEVLEEALQLSSLPEFEELLTPLVNQLAKEQHPFCLVLDDYHLIQNQTVHKMVSFLLDHRSGALRLVVATRADPPLPLARLRARGEMLELRQAELCFTVQEAADFLNRTMELQISAENTAQITERTEGWIAGLQLAALSMQNSRDITRFIATLTGSQHYIYDYLLEEILQRQPEEIKRFLVNTSILEQLNAPLCDAMFTGDQVSSPNRPSEVILDELEHANLFIIPLDHERSWYRYHPLFADLLRSHLQKHDAGQIPVLHTRASAWFEGQGLIADAIRHALAAGDWEHVLRLVSTNVFALLEQNELPSVARQFDRMLSEQSRARPWLWIGRAWLAAYTGELNSVEPFLKLAEGEIDSLDQAMAQQTLRGHTAAVRAFSNWIAGRRDVAVKFVHEALACLPATDGLIRCLTATVLGLSLSDFNARQPVFDQALIDASEIGISHVTIFAIGCKAYSLYMQGKLSEAHAVCREAIQSVEASSTRQPLPSMSYIYSTLSLLLYEWNDLEGSLQYAREGVALASRWQQADALHFALTCLNTALLAVGDIPGAVEVIRREWQIARRTSEWFEQITITQEIDCHLEQGNPEAALETLRQAHIDIVDPSNASLSRHLMFSIAKIRIAKKEYGRALGMIDSFIEVMEKCNINYLLVSALAWQALAYHRMNQETQALASLRRALALAAPERYVRTFMIAGNALSPLLHKARAAGITPEYVDQLLESLEPDNKPEKGGMGATPGLVEPLSQRELQVLKLLSQGCSDKEIAEALVIARETVHKHLKNIYGKLDVHSRSEAALRARTLRLL